MKSDTKIDDATARTDLSPRLTGGTLRGNPVINRYLQKLEKGNVDNNVRSSSTIELLQLAIGNETRHSSRIMAWDNQRIFGPYPENGNPPEKSDMDAD